MVEEENKSAGPQKVDVQDCLENTKINLHNARFNVQMLEAEVKKLEELAR